VSVVKTKSTPEKVPVSTLKIGQWLRWDDGEPMEYLGPWERGGHLIKKPNGMPIVLGANILVKPIPDPTEGGEG